MEAMSASNPNTQPHPDLFNTAGAGGMQQPDPKMLALHDAGMFVAQNPDNLDDIWAGLRSSASIREEASREIPWILEGLIPGGAISLITGDSKSGKTTFLLSVLRSMIDGSSWCGQEVEKATAWVFTEEGSRSLTEAMQVTGLEGDNHRFYQISSRRTVDWNVFIGKVEKAIISLQREYGELAPDWPPRLVIIDTFGIWSGCGDLNDYSKATAIYAPLHRLRDATQCAVVLVHHTRKEEGSVISGALGSTALTAQADVVLNLAKGKGNTRKFRSEGRFRGGLEEFKATYSPDLGGYLRGEVEVEGATGALDHSELAVLALFGADEEGPSLFGSPIEFPMKHLQEYRPKGMGRQNLRGIVRRLCEKGYLEDNGLAKTDPRLSYRVPTGKGQERSDNSSNYPPTVGRVRVDVAVSS